MIFADKLGELAVFPVHYDPVIPFLINVVLSGICRVIIIATLILTMNLPNVQWTVQQAEVPTNALYKNGPILVRINSNKRQVQLATGFA